MQTSQYNHSSNAHKAQTKTPIQLHRQAPTSQHNTHRSYYIKPLGYVAIVSIVLLLAIVSALICPDAAEGSVFLVILVVSTLFSECTDKSKRNKRN